MKKQELFALVDGQREYLFDLACQIFDHPEADGKEYFACQLLSAELERQGFRVERGVGNQETSFRAVWSNGTGGPNIGILGEYDALLQKGHGCGHHMQTPAAIGAAVALKKLFEGTDTPFTVTVYGTPAEETYGGKIIMQENGCFRELDVALSTHSTREYAFVGGSSMALISYRVTFKGKSAHAASAPYAGRSAADAMFLSFNGIEFMREHVKDGTRMHYTIKESLPPSNVVPERAAGGYTLRSRDNAYLKEIEKRFLDIIEGACLMTETEAELERKPFFAAQRRSNFLAEVAKSNLELLDVDILPELIKDSGGSTDFGNVSCTVPSLLVYLPYYPAPGHSDEWVAHGKTAHAESCIRNSAKVLAGIMYDMVTDPTVLEKAKEEFDAAK